MGLMIFVTIAFLVPDAFLPAALLAGASILAAGIYVARPALRVLVVQALVVFALVPATSRLVGVQIFALIVLISGVWALVWFVRAVLAHFFGRPGETTRVLGVTPHGSQLEVPEKLSPLARMLIAWIRRDRRQVAAKLRNPQILGSIPSIPAWASSAVDELTGMSFRFMGCVRLSRRAHLLVFHRESDGLVADILVRTKRLPFNMSVCSYLSNNGGTFSTASTSSLSRNSGLRQVFPDASPTELVEYHVATLGSLQALGLRVHVFPDLQTVLERYFSCASEIAHHFAELPDNDYLTALLKWKQRDYPDSGPLLDDRVRLERVIEIARSQGVEVGTSPSLQPSK